MIGFHGLTSLVMSGLDRFDQATGTGVTGLSATERVIVLPSETLNPQRMLLSKRMSVY
jgi:hypothetical protein